MDDYLDSFGNLDEAITTILDVAPFLKFRYFNLVTFISSSNRITLKILSLESLSSKVVNLDLEELLTDRVILIPWDAIIDMLKFKASNKVPTETKRGIFSGIGSIFDPLDLMDLVIIKIKLLIQELWRGKLNWDTEIPDYLLREWNSCRENLIKLSLLNLPCWINFSLNSEVGKLHIFADTSNMAYGTAALIKVRH